MINTKGSTKEGMENVNRVKVGGKKEEKIWPEPQMSTSRLYSSNHIKTSKQEIVTFDFSVLLNQM